MDTLRAVLSRYGIAPGRPPVLGAAVYEQVDVEEALGRLFAAVVDRLADGMDAACGEDFNPYQWNKLVQNVLHGATGVLSQPPGE